MAVTEKQLYEAFGLGEKAQEVAAPAAEGPTADTGEGAQGQEVAAPAQVKAEGDEGTQTEATAANAAPEDPEDDAADGTDASQQPLTPEQRRQNAARRRQQEQQAAISAAVDAALKAEREKQNAEFSAFFDRANLKNTITGQPIKSLEEFNEWDAQFRSAQLQRDLKAGKLTPESLDHAISNNPAVKRAQEMVSQQEEAARQQRANADRARIEAEIAAISKIDPTIQKVDDLLTMPRAKEFYELVKRGYSFKDAHYVLHGERLEKERLEAAKQQALNNSRGKDHLTATGNARGAVGASVPSDVMAMFRRFNPTATESQIREYYQKYTKG